MKHTKPMILAALAVITLLSFAACDAVLGSLVSGRVVNVLSSGSEESYFKTGDGAASLVGASITLTNIDNPNEFVSVSVDDDGSYAVGGLTAGMYRISGSKNGWTFIPQEVYIGGSILNLPDTLAYPTNEAGALTVVMAWEETDYDIDLKATYGQIINNGANPAIVQSDLIDDPNYTDAQEGSTTNSTLTAGYSMTLERDVTLDTPTDLPRVETIAIDAANGAIGDADFTGGHEIRFYADLFSKDDGSKYGEPEEGSLTGDDNEVPAYATMYVMYGAKHYGTWTLPLNSAEKTINMINVYVYDDGNGNSAFKVYSSGNYGDDVYLSVEGQY